VRVKLRCSAWGVILKLLNRLNGWNRIGLILTIIWLVGFPLYENGKREETRIRLASYSYRTCIEESVKHNDHRDCSRVFEDEYRKMNSSADGLKEYFFFSVVIATIAWIIIYLVIYVVWWVIRGFRAEPNS
jgi:hypothetical protein